MTRPRSYLDHNATTPLREESRAAMLAALDLCGAASSIHADGRASRKLMEAARYEVAALVGAVPKNVIFCGSATEASNLALSLDWQRGSKPVLQRAAISSIEHASVLNGARIRAEQTVVLPVDAHGIVDLAAAQAVLAEWQAEGVAGLVSVMLANNETGVVQPIAALADMVHAAGGILHCDAAQAAGKIAFTLADIGADLLTLSSHKLGGPPGAGALVLGSDVLHQPNPLLRGGGQERGLRAGTENVPALAGFGSASVAAKRDLDAYTAHCTALRDDLQARLKQVSPDLIVFGEGQLRLPNTLCFAHLGMTAETVLIALDLEGLSVSSGSACSSGKVRNSHVLRAMSVPDNLAACALRVSLAMQNTQADVDFFIAVWTRLHKSLHDRKHHQAA